MKKMFLKLLSKMFKLNKYLEPDFLLFLCTNESLPNPLTPEEEQEYLLKLQNGDENAKNLLIERNLRLVVYIAKKFENTGVELDDLISVGSIGLIKAVSTFNLDKKIKIATYASRCIENEILMHLRKVSKQRKETSLDKPLSFDSDGNELLLGDVLGIDVDEVYSGMETSDEKDAVWKVLSSLDEREQEIMKMRFGLMGQDEMTQKEVADLLNISQSYISRIEKKILGKMKKNISKYM